MKHDAADLDALARGSARTFAFTFLSAAMIALIGWTVVGMWTPWHWYVAVAVSAAFCLFVLTYRHMPSAVSATLFLFTSAVLLICGAIDSYKMAASGSWSVITFAAYKLLPIAVAFVAPMPLWTGFMVIGVCAIAPAIQTFVAPEDVRRNYSMLEPWITYIYVTVAAFVFRHRLKSIAMERTLTRLQAERRALDDLARIFLGLRDLTNTPLQSIELTAALIRMGHMSPEDASSYLEQALVRLRELSLVLSTYEKHVDWSSTESSFDAVALLQQKLDEVRSGSLSST